MIVESELLELARQRESAVESALAGMLLDPPHFLRREYRAYLARLLDRNRIMGPVEAIPQLNRVQGGFEELVCPELSFSSGARLEFNVRLEQEQGGWLVRRFHFCLDLPQQRRINRVRIELNPEGSHNPLEVPRCHMHIDNSQAHIPFPVMNPRLILHVICDQIEPDVGS